MLGMFMLLLFACSTEPAELDVMLHMTDPDPPTAGDVVATLHLSWADDGGDVTDADVLVTPWMTAHAHGIDTAPEVTELGDGLYEAAFAFSMPGTWELQVDVDDGAGTGSVEVEVQ
jgi:hypothetical protein